MAGWGSSSSGCLGTRSSQHLVSCWQLAQQSLACGLAIWCEPVTTQQKHLFSHPDHHVAVTVHRILWNLEKEKTYSKTFFHPWKTVRELDPRTIKFLYFNLCYSSIPLSHLLMLIAWCRECEWEEEVNWLIPGNYCCYNVCGCPLRDFWNCCCSERTEVLWGQV